MIELVLGVLAGLSAGVAGIFAIRSALGWLFPIHIAPGVLIRRKELGPDEIQATITNRSREPLYIIRCRGRSAYSLGRIVRTHLRHPLIKPRLYQCVWFGANVYDMMGSEPIKLEAHQPLKLSHQLTFELPLFAFSTPMVQVEVVLSNRRVFRSRRLPVPKRWQLLHHLEEHRKHEAHA